MKRGMKRSSPDCKPAGREHAIACCRCLHALQRYSEYRTRSPDKETKTLYKFTMPTLKL